jgi:hypothetical protein
MGWGKKVLEAQLMRAGGYGKIDTGLKAHFTLFLNIV